MDLFFILQILLTDPSTSLRMTKDGMNRDVKITVRILADTHKKMRLHF